VIRTRLSNASSSESIVPRSIVLSFSVRAEKARREGVFDAFSHGATETRGFRVAIAYTLSE